MAFVKLRNFCPHSITLFCAEGRRVLPSEGCARVEYSPGSLVCILDGVPIFGAPVFGEVTGLPAAAPGVWLIVSAIVASRCGHRSDVVSPGTGPYDCAVRSEAGIIMGVTRLIASQQAVNGIDRLSVRAQHCLENMGVTDLRQLSDWRRREVLRTKHLGRATLAEIESAMEAEGIQFMLEDVVEINHPAFGANDGK